MTECVVQMVDLGQVIVRMAIHVPLFAVVWKHAVEGKEMDKSIVMLLQHVQYNAFMQKVVAVIMEMPI